MTTDDRTDGQQAPTPLSNASAPAIVDTLAYPISPDYVKSWTPVRGLCELIANALDEDHDANVAWADGVLRIADDGPGIPEEGLILGYSTKTNAQIGQFGEGKKLACLILARSPGVGAVRCETVGYGFVPTVERRRLLGGLIPSRSEQGAEVLVYNLYRTDRTRGTVITVECPKELADEAIGRFRALSEPGYAPPAMPGTCVLTGDPGRVWIGGVLVTTVPGFLASYDLPLDDKALQNRDRTVIEAGALRDAVRAILAASDAPPVVDRFAAHVLAGEKLREAEQFFSGVILPRARAAWRTWGRAHLPAQTFYTSPGNEEAALDLKDNGFAEVTARGLAAHHQRALMDLLGVEIAHTRQRRHYEKTRDKTTWVPERKLTQEQHTALATATQLVRRGIGSFALDQVRVYAESESSPCADGFYNPRSGAVAVHVDALADRSRLLEILLHEAAHRVAHLGGGRWAPRWDYGDRCRGFEEVLGDFAALLLGYLADGAKLPDAVETPNNEPPASRVHRSGADDPAVPVTRRELAHLLIERLPHALTAGGFADAKDMVASTAVHADFWRTLTNPKPAGFRAQMGRGRAWDYDKTSLLADAVGVHSPVVWLAYNLCEGSMYARRREQWGQPGPWAKQMREVTLRACADLDALGGAYAAQVPALRALLTGQTPAPTGDDCWQAPARTLLALERHRLGLDAQPA
ncbi:hypothetical protein [Krasilnikovia sp. MM14-A1259]|uniref:hypothetical protein n=1 Tax=Krasilnikovia sp. MM14-A1259 TaxID=3373539 RepID=UPI0038035335